MVIEPRAPSPLVALTMTVAEPITPGVKSRVSRSSTIDASTNVWSADTANRSPDWPKASARSIDTDWAGNVIVSGSMEAVN